MAQTVIITGAASGIGLACAEHQLSLGWRVALDLEPDHLREQVPRLLEVRAS